MYYEKNNIYISKDKSILFDLNLLDIYQIDKNTFNIFEKLYNDSSKVEKDNKHEMEIYNSFFKNPSYYRKNDYKITSVRINVSNMCNFKCSYCFANQGNYSKEDKLMDTETAKKICNYIKSNFKYVTDIGFFGGEPFLNYKAIKTICEEMPAGTRFNIITNMSILNEDIIHLIKKYNISVTASIDGTKEINDLNRITKNDNPTYDLVSKNIKQLLDNNIKLSMIESTYTSFAHKKYSKIEIAKFLSKEFHAKHILISDVDTKDPEFKLPYDSVYNKDNLTMSLESIFSNIASNKIILTCIEAKALIFFVTKDNTDHFCTPGITTLIFDENGDIWPCQSFISKEKFKMGNISDNLDENTNFDLVQKKLFDFRKSKQKECKNCVAKYWCQACLPRILSEDNDSIDIKKEMCKRNKQITEQTLDILASYVNYGSFNQLLKNMSEMFS